MDKQVDWRPWKIAYTVKSYKVDLERKQLNFAQKAPNMVPFVIYSCRV